MTTNESTEQGVREALRVAFIGPRNRLPIGSAVTLDQLKQIRWDSATSDERADALWAADAILATLSPDDIRREERERCARIAEWYANQAREVIVPEMSAEAFTMIPPVIQTGEAIAAAIRSQPSREGEK